MHKLVLASAGAGKSSEIARQALDAAREGNAILILTYTISNQKELVKKICEYNKTVPKNIKIKGWFTFLLEDMIRPYQRCIFPNRIAGINFNKSNPHINAKNHKQIKGRAEKIGNTYNRAHYLTPKENAHTAFLSKLAFRVGKESNGKPANRISKIYDIVFIDEVQDLVGYDFEIIAALKACALTCVGDFRQTIYQTHVSSKQPETNSQKIAWFNNANFVLEHKNISWRSIKEICDLADLVHVEGGYQKTISKVETVPEEFADHQGVFIIRSALLSSYLAQYNPTILRTSKSTRQDICEGHITYNFGVSKGMGFDRILIIPTQKHESFLQSKQSVFDNDKTEEAKNTLYVAITRARYSVAFVYDGNIGLSGVNVWTT